MDMSPEHHQISCECHPNGFQIEAENEMDFLRQFLIDLEAHHDPLDRLVDLSFHNEKDRIIVQWRFSFNGTTDYQK